MTAATLQTWGSRHHTGLLTASSAWVSEPAGAGAGCGGEGASWAGRASTLPGRRSGEVQTRSQTRWAAQVFGSMASWFLARTTAENDSEWSVEQGLVVDE